MLLYNLNPIHPLKYFPYPGSLIYESSQIKLMKNLGNKSDSCISQEKMRLATNHWVKLTKLLQITDQQKFAEVRQTGRQLQ